MANLWRFFVPCFTAVFSASRVQHISDLHSKFALPHHVSKYGRHAICETATAENRRGKKKEEEITRMWANAQRGGRPAEYRWRPLFNATKFG